MADVWLVLKIKTKTEKTLWCWCFICHRWCPILMGCMFIQFESELSLSKPPPQKSMARHWLKHHLREKTSFHFIPLKNRVAHSIQISLAFRRHCFWARRAVFFKYEAQCLFSAEVRWPSGWAAPKGDDEEKILSGRACFHKENQLHSIEAQSAGTFRWWFFRFLFKDTLRVEI